MSPWALGDTKPNIPDWVRQISAEKLPPYPSDTDAVVLLSEETDTVTAPDEHIEHYRRIVKILRPAGRDEGELSVWIGHDEKLISIHAWSIDAAGHEYELKDKDFISHSNVYYAMYSDIYRKSAIAPAAAPGTTVVFEYEIKRSDYFNELSWTPQENIPVCRAILTVQLPKGWELKDYWSGEGSAKSASGGSNSWQWVKTDLPAIEDEPRRPARTALAGRLTIQLYTADHPLGANWAAVAKWADGLFRAQRTTSPDMAVKVDELTRGKTDFDAKVRAITEFVQTEFRYYAIEIGIGGFQPHPASEVFKARYGDCKDKANTLSTLLSLAGIGSVPVLIHTDRGVVRPEMPSTHFDHAILAIELPADIPTERYPTVVTTKSGKRYVIFDPTDEWMPFGEVRSELQDSYALLVTESGGELIRVPVLKPDASQLIRSAKLKLTPEGTLSGEVREQLTGDFAEEIRIGTQATNQQQQLQYYERLAAGSLKNAAVDGLSFDGLKQLSAPIDVHYSISAQRYAQIAGPLLIVRPRVLGEKSIALDNKPRKYPFVLGYTCRQTDEFELQIPDGYVVDDKPDPVSIDTPFASYKSKVEVSGSRLRYSREYVTKSLELPADRMNELRAFETRIAADENSAVVFKKIAAAGGQD
ncbi:MAG TPA: DUF3857 and transglutaminase domain-containing protein [Terriglobales bacterium]|nr:DUF3857 and transglutaminase domain-containing protein [Terriglobales bacterium]